MLLKCSLAIVFTLTAACSGGASEPGGDQRLIVPEKIQVLTLGGGNGDFELSALTLQAGSSGPELFASLRNNGSLPACSAAVSIELFDASEQSIAAGLGGLTTSHFFRLTDGSGTIAACVAPGDVAMAAISDWPSGWVVEDVGFAVYRLNYFGLDAERIGELDVSSVKTTTNAGDTAFSGVLLNGLAVPVQSPSVSIFPVNRAGRPLGVATARGTAEIAPGGSWVFETNGVNAPGSDYVAYPAAALVK